MCMCSWAAAEILKNYDASKSMVQLISSNGSKIEVVYTGPAPSEANPEATT